MRHTAKFISRGGRVYNGYSASRPAILGIAKALCLGITQLSFTDAAPFTQLLHKSKDDTPTDAEDPSLLLYLGIATVLVLLGGAFAGLTIALMGQDGVYLQVIATSGEGKEQRHAQQVYSLLQKGKHWVLVTLLLSNVIVNESLPIVLDRSLGGGWPAVLSSTVLIVIFGEVIPQSVCVRYGLQIGAFMSPFVLVLMWLLGPIAWPTAKLLDRLLGEDHGTVYKKSGLKTLVTLHKTLGTSPGDRLNQDEVTIISAVLDLKDKPVGDIMTPMEDVFTMSADTILDEKTMDIILSAGYSRIPIYEPGNDRNFVGMLLVKILITYDPEDCKRVSEFALATLPETRPETSCLDIVNFFQEGKSHMVLVSEYPGENFGATGVVTLEDVIEELIGEEIIDESDVYIDVHKAIRRMAPAPKASRLSKSQILSDHDIPEIKAFDEILVDISDPSEITDRPPPQRSGSVGSRTNSPVTFGSSPKTTFMMRRSSSAADGSTALPIAVRGNVADMREHLKHLGPSNLASRPKSTRYNTVKIKPGHVTTAADPKIRHYSLTGESYRDIPAPNGGEGAGLLKSAGRDASDGVQALQQGYGSLDGRSSLPKSIPRSSEQVHKSTQINVDGPSYRSSSPKSSSDRPPAHNVDSIEDSQHSSDTLGSLRSKDGSPAPRKRGVARSGSITENIIDAGGVRKVVLETNSSSDPEDLEAMNEGAFPNGRKKNESKTSIIADLSNQTDRGKNDVQEEDVKKKQKRRRKRKGAHNDEEPGASKS